MRRGRLTPAEQEKRERLRLGAVKRLETDEATAVIARELRVTERSVRR